MKFGIFYEHQLPRPWDDGAEHKLLKDALDQIELADRPGYDHVWEVEHHFLEEYSHSGAPEVFLAAASQRTSQIRLGHGIVQLPFGFNHTARVVERINTLDLLSDGRVDFGTGESSLSLLRAVPAAIVKLDKSFVDGIEIDDGRPGAADARQAVARAVIQLAHALGLDTVAEGIESAEQVAALLDLGYTRGQGFYLAEPMPAAGVSRLLARQRSVETRTTKEIRARSS